MLPLAEFSRVNPSALWFQLRHLREADCFQMNVVVRVASDRFARFLLLHRILTISGSVVF